MSPIDWIVNVCLVLLGACIGWIFRVVSQREWLANRARHLMIDARPRDVANLRTLLTLDGHRMPKRLRDAIAVWLAEREGGQA